MAAYQFETITPGEALAIRATDTILTGDGATEPRVTYLDASGTDPARVQVTLGTLSFEHTVVFNTNIEQLSIEGRFTLDGPNKLIIGSNANETLNGDIHDYVFGGGGADSLTGGRELHGGAGDDTLSGPLTYGEGGNDRLVILNNSGYADGGANFDTLIFSGNRSEYHIYQDNGSFHASSDGFRSVIFDNIESLHFNDRDISLTNIISVTSAETGPLPAEGDAGQLGHKFIASRTGDTGSELTTSWHAQSYNGADLAAANGQVTFAAGQSQAEFFVYTLGDTEPEAAERFNVTLDDGPLWLFNGREASAGVANDDGDAYVVLNVFRSDQLGKAEGQSGSTDLTFTVKRDGDTTIASHADYRVVPVDRHSASADDFVGGAFPTGSISFVAGETEKLITLHVNGDMQVGGDEYFKLQLVNISAQSSVNYGEDYDGAVGIILNDDYRDSPDGPGNVPSDSGSDDGSNSPGDDNPGDPGNGSGPGDGAGSGGSTGGSDAGDDNSSTPPPPSAGIIGGDNGPDTIQGTSGDDTIVAGDGVGYLRGGEGNDVIAGGKDFDDINGNQGADTASGGTGDDWVVGGKDNDSLTGDGGGDIVYGNLGDDSCDGGDGADIVRGGQGNDLVLGGAGNDWLSGDRGDDTVTGGAGADIFHTFGDAGTDRVTDFSLAEGDRVMLDPGTTYSLSQVGGDTVIAMGGGGQMVLVGVSMASLTGDWIFGA